MESDGQFPPQSTLLKLDFSGRELARFAITNQIRSVLVADLRRDRNFQVFTPDGDGYLNVLDLQLRLQQRMPIAPKTHDWVDLTLVAVADLQGDGHNELVFASSQAEFISGRSQGRPDSEFNVRHFHDNAVLVFTDRLEFLAKHQLSDLAKAPAGWHAIILSEQGQTASPVIVALQEKATVLSFTRLPSKRPIPTVRTNTPKAQ